MNALIGTGFYCDHNNRGKRIDFAKIWFKNIGDRDVVVVDNSEMEPYLSMCLWGHSLPNARVIEVRKNLGHVGSYIGQYRPHLLGWAMSWIIPATIAYSEGRDFCYFEQDTLAFGGWEKSILDDMEKNKLLCAFGKAEPSVAQCEQSIFYIKHEYITEFIYNYLSFPEGDGMMVPETKFKKISQRDFRCGEFTLFGGRMRPIPDSDTFYIQKITQEEMEVLKQRGLV